LELADAALDVSDDDDSFSHEEYLKQLHINKLYIGRNGENCNQCQWRNNNNQKTSQVIHHRDSSSGPILSSLTMQPLWVQCLGIGWQMHSYQVSSVYEMFGKTSAFAS
jgi:hypothetical protein